MTMIIIVVMINHNQERGLASTSTQIDDRLSPGNITVLQGNYGDENVDADEDGDDVDDNDDGEDDDEEEGDKSTLT